MKTIFFRAMVLVLASIMTMEVFAEDRMSLRAGFLRTNNVAEAAGVSSVSVETHNYGFYAGLGSETPVKRIKNLYFDAAALYTYLGDRTGDLREDIHMLNFPLRAKYKGYVSDNLAAFVYAGPVGSIGISARDKQGNTSVSLYGADGMLNRFDVKLGLGVGVELSDKLVFKIGYDWGIFNMSKVYGVNMHMNWYYFGLALNI